MSDYDQGYYAGQRASAGHSYQSGKAAGTLLGLGLVIGFRLAVETLVAAPFLLVALALTTSLDFLGTGYTEARLLSIGALAYFFYALLYCLKGVAVGSRLRGGWRWLVPFAVCLTTACLVPALLLHLFIVRAAPATAASVAWGLPAMFALFAYVRHRLTTDYAPGWVLWSYRLGYRWTTS